MHYYKGDENASLLIIVINYVGNWPFTALCLLYLWLLLHGECCKVCCISIFSHPLISVLLYGEIEAFSAMIHFKVPFNVSFLQKLTYAHCSTLPL